MGRLLIVLGLAGLALAALFPVGTHGSPATPAAPAVPLAGSTLTFVKAEVSTCPPFCHPLPEHWKAQYQIATWTPPWGHATYQYSIPPTIPPAGADVTLTVTVTANPGSRFAPAVGLSGDIDIEGGPAQASALAESGQSASGEKKVKLVPRRYANGAAVQIVVGLLDGPRVTYTYRASNPATGCPRRSVASAGVACLKSFQFSAAAHHPSNIRTPTGHARYPWHVYAASFGKDVLLTYYQGVSDEDRGARAVRRGAKVTAEVEDTHVVVSGVTKVLKLEVVVRSNRDDPLFDKLLPCRDGARGTVVVIDDQRLLPGGDKDQSQARDKVIVNIPRCDYLSHTFTNADSHSHTPFVGGPTAVSPTRSGGQWAIARVRTTG